ncbi:MAG TPA: LysM peptidoglycan-binding domain-containing protein [Spirochaetota bacterium]|nr:LysM peptidoglycan-binding domain-containing protein [Spirochaetota bacterium]
MRGYYKKIKGKQYDGHLIRLADESVKGKGDGRISLKDAKKILAAVKDSDAYTDIEKATMHFIRDHYAFTGEANAWFRTEIRKWAATKGAAAGSAKKRVPAVKKAAAATPVKKQKPKAAPKKTAKKAVKKHARPSAAPKKEPVYVTESFEERARFDQRVVEHEEEKRSSRFVLALVLVAFLAIGALIVFYPKLQRLFTKSDDAPVRKDQPAQDASVRSVTPSKDAPATDIPSTMVPAKDAAAPGAGAPPKFESYKAEGRENYDYYIVKPKETLVTIGEQLTGKYWDWEKLFNENKRIIKDPRVVYAGQIIKIPDSMKKQIERRQSKTGAKSVE